MTWLKSYIGWMRLWIAPWRPNAYGYREGPFSRCPDCGKRNCLSAHLKCIPF